MLGGENARVGFVEPIEKGVVLAGKKAVAAFRHLAVGLLQVER